MKKLEDIFVTFTEDELNNTLTTLAEWCEGGYLLDDMLDASDLFEQFKYLMEVREVLTIGDTP